MKLIVAAGDGPMAELQRRRAEFMAPTDSLGFINGQNSTAILVEKLCAKYGNPKVYRREDFNYGAAVFIIPSNFGVNVMELRQALPFLLISSVDYSYNKLNIKEIGSLKKELGRIRRLIAALEKEYRERDSKTPLLLPIENFGELSLKVFLGEIQDHASPQPDLYPSLRSAIDSYASGALSVFPAGKQTAFRNRRDILFVAPKKAGPRHGIPNGLPPHSVPCLLNGVFRIGVQYDVQFHYDCQRERGTIKGHFSDCHGEDHFLAGEKYVNIAPNDAIR